MVEIKDLDDPRIAFYKSLRYTPLLHIHSRVFIAEGEKVVLRLLASSLEIHSIFATMDFYEKYHHLIQGKGIPEDKRFFASKNLMERIVGFHLHSGIMAIGFQPKDVSLDELSEKVVVLNQVNNAENVGLIMRTCRAFGIDSIIVDRYSTSPYLRRAVRVSMGNVFYLKVRHSDDLIEDLSHLRLKGFQIVACEVIDISVDLFKFEFSEKSALIFGNEGKGISDELINFSDVVVQIPISRNVDSLNVAITCGIFLCEIKRQGMIKNVVNR